ncbi:MAG: hypothetical protein ACD_65C00056G0002 [uncultured bacterium]|nr:MAG: hypothetical protein ACD_65C00056G0002 [uncultured bacterium]
MNFPYLVSRSVSTCFSISFSLWRRYSIRFLIEISVRLCFFEKFLRSGSLIISPSSLVISHNTPASLRPASRAKSYAASVWPALWSMPPFLAINGKMCPGLTRSFGFEFGSIRVLIVFVRSEAEIPVVISVLLSTETVKLHFKDSSFSSTIGFNSNFSAIPGEIGTQISPRPSRIMKLIFSGVTFSAAKIKSPSFSRSSSSTTTTIFPDLISRMAFSIFLLVLIIVRPPIEQNL